MASQAPPHGVEYWTQQREVVNFLTAEGLSPESDARLKTEVLNGRQKTIALFPLPRRTSLILRAAATAWLNPLSICDSVVHHSCAFSHHYGCKTFTG